MSKNDRAEVRLAEMEIKPIMGSKELKRWKSTSEQS
jgi:hypothetical protein